jgi:hypothetical protein
MDNYLSTYSHNGVEYIHDSYTGDTIPASIWRAIRDSIPVPQYSPTPPTKQQLAQAAKHQAKIYAQRATKAELISIAKNLAKNMKVSPAQLDEWRIANGYLWKVISPRGTVYTEVLKQCTIKNPEDYIVYNSMWFASREWMHNESIGISNV